MTRTHSTLVAMGTSQTASSRPFLWSMAPHHRWPKVLNSILHQTATQRSFSHLQLWCWLEKSIPDVALLVVSRETSLFFPQRRGSPRLDIRKGQEEEGWFAYQESVCIFHTHTPLLQLKTIMCYKHLLGWECSHSLGMCLHHKHKNITI